jgi:hypothetical protein
MGLREHIAKEMAEELANIPADNKAVKRRWGTGGLPACPGLPACLPACLGVAPPQGSPLRPRAMAGPQPERGAPQQLPACSALARLANAAATAHALPCCRTLEKTFKELNFEGL